ncbi:Two component system, signal transduction response regulator [Acididesulfobacillus acetoxydans]|uniref:Stage 0 sporulation protein A homolog n=1 Tax=Acididesulfobacillus acetoxydans TaxID=1561005 RepID=A0A8S0WX13_9FIRM|nr:response regulator [Acididesulfobacillus acetoxydans]CAA7600661.1 Two component system, signal transduction response regulator [Acididesulfobacillus acetoxydans]CEJ09442.1 Response regulator with CheY-like receiver, AAA-type ATPase, and DNA-binding domains [Acididesulfobacillus acetoxydans]
MGHRVLVADDASFMRLMIRQVLLRLGCTEVLEAGNGWEAIEIYLAKRPVLTVLDITMPELNGLKALEQIISFDPQARVIICSAISHSNVVRQALDLGAVDFIAKPFRAEELEKTLIKHLGAGNSS